MNPKPDNEMKVEALAALTFIVICALFTLFLTTALCDEVTREVEILENTGSFCREINYPYRA